MADLHSTLIGKNVAFSVVTLLLLFISRLYVIKSIYINVLVFLFYTAFGTC